MPRTHNGLWDHVCAWPNLLAAHHAARRGKRYRGAVLRFDIASEERLIEIHEHLLHGTWRPADYREFRIIDPKPRLIQAPPYDDRVVHHALVRVIQPLFERRFIGDSYACREGKGTQAAVARVQRFLRVAQRRWGGVYVLQADIRRYFQSISHDRLLEIVGRVVRDRRTLDLCERIIRHDGGAHGIPVGALTSQLFANAYLDRLDHHVKDTLGLPYYLRYLDDWIILGPDKTALHRLQRDLERWLAVELGLALNPKTDIYQAAQGVDFCGYRTWTTHILPRKRNVRRARRAMRALTERFAAGRCTAKDLHARIASFAGYLRHCQGSRRLVATLQEVPRAV